MTFKELAAQLNKLQEFTTTENESLLSKLKNKPFWILDEQKHQKSFLMTNGNCCFNHIVGLLQKDERYFPLFDYEKILYDTLMSRDGSFKDKHLWVKKATGLGATCLHLEELQFYRIHLISIFY